MLIEQMILLLLSIVRQQDQHCSTSTSPVVTAYHIVLPTNSGADALSHSLSFSSLCNFQCDRIHFYLLPGNYGGGSIGGPCRTRRVMNSIQAMAESAVAEEKDWRGVQQQTVSDR